MRALTAPDLLDAWESCRNQRNAGDRAIVLLAAAERETPPAALAELSIGERDARLLTLREWAFGSRLAGVVDCPACADRLEFEFSTSDIRAPARLADEQPLWISADDYEVRFRLPNGTDLAAVTAQENDSQSRDLLFGRCILSAQHRGQDTDNSQLPEHVVAAVMERMEQADPQAVVQLTVECPACGHRWLTSMDIASFFWEEINAWATRVLREVHTLATAYGWRELDILSMSPVRRQLYLEMVGG
jgi:hypothetical protein